MGGSVKYTVRRLIRFRAVLRGFPNHNLLRRGIDPGKLAEDTSHSLPLLQVLHVSSPRRQFVEQAKRNVSTKKTLAAPGVSWSNFDEAHSLAVRVIHRKLDLLVFINLDILSELL